jgi:hypothetical protein
MWFPNVAIDFVFVLDMVILYFLAIRFRWCAPNNNSNERNCHTSYSPCIQHVCLY